MPSKKKADVPKKAIKKSRQIQACRTEGGQDRKTRGGKSPDA